MKQNINGVNAKLYRWFYNESQMPTNLCPYFWKIVFMWITIIPVSLISIPTILIDLFFPAYGGFGNWLTRTIMGFCTWCGIGMLILLLIGIIASVYCTIFDHAFVTKHLNDFYCWWSIDAIVFGGTIYSICYNKWTKRHNNKSYYYQDKTPNMFIEFIKAKYNKYCPKIDWEYSDDKPVRNKVVSKLLKKIFVKLFHGNWRMKK